MDETSLQLWYWGSSLALAFLLFFPVEKMLWVMRVRSAERRLKRVTTPGNVVKSGVRRVLLLE